MADKLVKLMDENGYHQLINMLISIKSNAEAEVDKCISIWQPRTRYEKDKVVLVVNDNTYSEYVCKATHVSGETFNETYWTLVSCVDFEGYTEEELLAMLNLSETELQNLQSLINDSQISTSSVYSSSKLYSELQEIFNKSKDYVDNQVSKAVKPSYKTVTSTSEMTDGHYIYLLSNGTNYDMYILEEDGTPKNIGNSDIDLSQFTPTTELEADYLKKADATGTYATIETVDEIKNTYATIESVDEFKEKALTVDDVATTISTTSTDEQWASAKAVNDLVLGLFTSSYKNTTFLKNTFRNDAYSLTIYTDANELPVGLQSARDLLNAPASAYVYYLTLFFDGNGGYRVQLGFVIQSYDIYIRYMHNNVWKEWKKIALVTE